MSDLDEAYADRQHLSFAQAEGAEPLPAQLQPKQISSEMRALLWFVVHESMKECISYSSMGGSPHLGSYWLDIMRSYEIFFQHCMVDELDSNAKRLIKKAKSNFELFSTYTDMLGFIQFVLRHSKCPSKLYLRINQALERSCSAYRVFSKNTIIPIGSNAEAQVLYKAFADLDKAEFRGARSHLSTAGSFLTNGEFAESVRESIHSVESVARVITETGALSDALAKLEKYKIIHVGLKKGFNSIYGYSSDEKGIRHPLIDDPAANVDEADALFMIGACASFVSYMIHKSRIAGLLERNQRPVSTTPS